MIPFEELSTKGTVSEIAPNGNSSGIVTDHFFLDLPTLDALSVSENVNTLLTGGNDTRSAIVTTDKKRYIDIFYTIFPINSTTNHTLLSFVNMDQEEKQKLLHLIQETNQIIEDLMQLFERTEKSLHLIKERKENIEKWTTKSNQINKMMYNYTTTLRIRGNYLQKQLDKQQNHLLKD